MNYFKVCQLSKPSLCFPVFYFTGENDFYPAANFIECKMCHFMLANSKHNSRSRVTQKSFTPVFSQNSRIAGLAVRESLSAAADSSCLITNVLLHYGCTNCQCGNKRGFSLYFCFSHFTAAFLYKPFSHFTHFNKRALSWYQTLRVCAVQNANPVKWK